MRTTAQLISLPTNALIVSVIQEAAELLHQQGAPSVIVDSYNAASTTVSRSASLVDTWRRHGLSGLLRDGKLRPGLALAASEILRTGSWWRTKWLRGNESHSSELYKLPGFGPTLESRLNSNLGVMSLEQLYFLSKSKRLGMIEGFARHRLNHIAGFLERTLRVGDVSISQHETKPRTRLLLKLDAEFRARVRAHAACVVESGEQSPPMAILHAIVGQWNCSLKTLEGGPESAVSVTFENGDLLFEQYVVRTDPRSGERFVPGMEVADLAQPALAGSF